MVVQSTSPMFARDSYWCIVETLKQAGLKTYPYHVYVPSFGEWGFVIASTHEYTPPTLLPAGLRFVIGRRPAGDVPVPARHVADADAAQSFERPGPGARLRSGLEGHQPLRVSRAEVSAGRQRGAGWDFRQRRSPDRRRIRQRLLPARPQACAIAPLSRPPRRSKSMPVVIVGGGIAGLSAAWRLHKRGFKDFVLLEMNEQAGGNSRWGENEITAYPWAAHYVPVPGPKATYVRELFEELGVLKRWRMG